MNSNSHVIFKFVMYCLPTINAKFAKFALCKCFLLQFTVGGLINCFLLTPKHFIEIRRVDEDGEFGLVKRTETLKGETITATIVMSGTRLNNGDNQRTLQIELYAYKSNGRHRKFGAVQTQLSIANLMLVQVSSPFKSKVTVTALF